MYHVKSFVLPTIHSYSSGSIDRLVKILGTVASHYDRKLRFFTGNEVTTFSDIQKSELLIVTKLWTQIFLLSNIVSTNTLVEYDYNRVGNRYHKTWIDLRKIGNEDIIRVF